MSGLATDRTHARGDVLALGSLLLTLGGLVAAAVGAAIQEDFVGASSIAFALTVVGVSIWLRSRRHQPRRVGDTTQFRPFTSLEEIPVWPRSEDAARIAIAALADRPSIPIVVGASGVGKSVLLRVLVEEYMSSHHPEVSYSVVTEDFVTFPQALQARFEGQFTGRTVLVLDQLEQWLMYVSLLPINERQRERAALKQALVTAKEISGLGLVLSIRREWYYDLRFLEDDIPAPSGACDIQSPRSEDREGESQQAILLSFARVLSSRPVAEGILERIGSDGRLSPLKAQIVGAAVEIQVESGIEIDLRYFDTIMGGVPGAIDGYFEMVLDGARDPKLCMKILCALSLKAQLRRHTQLYELVACVSDDRRRVQDAVRYLVGRGLVTAHGSSRYDLVHDFVAEYFDRKSAEVLTPTERDSIVFYARDGGAHNGIVLTQQEYEATRRHRNAGRTIAAFCTGLMALRLFYFGVDTTAIGPIIARPVFGNTFDATYILTFVPVVAWIFYIGSFFDAVLNHLNESRPARGLSLFLLATLVMAAVIDIAVPFVWLLVVAIGGVIFSGKLLTIARRRELTSAAHRQLMATGWSAISNLTFAAVIGGAAAYTGFRYVDGGERLELWLSVNLLLAAMATYWSAMLFPRHLSRRATSQWLGLLGRSRTMRDGD
jgi:hypothetical protein